jgi:hypothetical protein
MGKITIDDIIPWNEYAEIRMERVKLIVKVKSRRRID